MLQSFRVDGGVELSIDPLLIVACSQQRQGGVLRAIERMPHDSVSMSKTLTLAHHFIAGEPSISALLTTIW